MKANLAFLWFAAASALGVDPRIEEARRALEDGLPQVAIYNLSQTSGSKLARGDQATAELLLARALFAAGRFEESAALLKKSGKPGPETRFWLAEANAALNKPAEALPLYEGLIQDERYSSQAAVGAARMLSALGRRSEASEVPLGTSEKESRRFGRCGAGARPNSPRRERSCRCPERSLCRPRTFSRAAATGHLSQRTCLARGRRSCGRREKTQRDQRSPSPAGSAPSGNLGGMPPSAGGCRRCGENLGRIYRGKSPSSKSSRCI